MYSLTSSVYFVGHIEGKEKQYYFEASDLFVLTSHTENFGMSIAEALVYGVPTITTINTPWTSIHKKAGWCVGLEQTEVDKAVGAFFKSSQAKLLKCLCCSKFC